MFNLNFRKLKTQKSKRLFGVEEEEQWLLLEVLTKKMTCFVLIPSSPSLHLDTRHFLRNCYLEKKNK